MSLQFVYSSMLTAKFKEKMQMKKLDSNINTAIQIVSTHLEMLIKLISFLTTVKFRLKRYIVF